MSINKLAILRSDSTHPCPFGLGIPGACTSVGTAIHDMQPLDEVPDEEQEKYKQANRRIYRHSADGTRCPFADKVLKNRDFVVCDYGDVGSGEHSVALRPSPYYPRVFVGLGQTGLYSYPFGSYPRGTHNDSFPDQIFDGVYQSYVTAGMKEDQTCYEFCGDLEKTAAPISSPAKISERAWVHVRAPDGKILIRREFDSLEQADEWSRTQVGPGKTVDLEVEIQKGSELQSLNDLSPQQVHSAAARNPELFRRLPPDEARNLIRKVFTKSWFTGAETLVEEDKAEEVWIEASPQTFLRYSSIDGSPFELKYRKIEHARTAYWFRADGEEELVTPLDSVTVDLYTADTTTDSTNKTH